MMNLAHQRCLNHVFREAVARCTECWNYYCRECVTEHEDRLICAGCLRALSKPATIKQFRLAGLLLFLECVLGVLIAWLFFYWVGQGLLALPNSFHDGSIWNAGGAL